MDIAAVAAYIIHTVNNDMVRHETEIRIFVEIRLDLEPNSNLILFVQAMRLFLTKSEIILKKYLFGFEAATCSKRNPKKLKAR